MERISQPFRSKSANRIGYVSLVVVALVHLVINEPGQAGIYLGIALIFDPFDPAIAFPKRPGYQQVILSLHAIMVLSSIAFDHIGVIQL